MDFKKTNFISHMVQIIRKEFLYGVDYRGNAFISHMVQIIHEGGDFDRQNLILRLYIPHGSDNTFL